MEQWYTLHTKPNAEYECASILQERGIHTYLPEIKTAHSNQEREPFFPCYLFSKIDFEAIGLSHIQWTPGLRRIVTFDEQPTPIPAEVIELIQKKLREFEATQQGLAHSFKKGDTVKIKEGPFQDMLAVFDGPSTPSERVQVLLDILGNANRVQVDVCQLEEHAEKGSEPQPKRRRRSRGQGRTIRYSD
ncbi:MAG: hypothetical protein KDJ65_18430 [Anaerolineae bacterium]|nr:hypothetical protein [Anaerolineae bacterium]